MAHSVNDPGDAQAPSGGGNQEHGETGSPVHLAIADGVATLRMNSPANRNALSVALVDAVLSALAEAAVRADVHAVVLGRSPRVGVLLWR